MMSRMKKFVLALGSLAMIVFIFLLRARNIFQMLPLPSPDEVMSPTSLAPATLYIPTKAQPVKTRKLKVRPFSSWDAKLGYRLTPLCGWLDKEHIPPLDPHPKMLVRSVFLDSRPRDKHQNASVFLLEVEKPIFHKRLITGCRVDGKNATSFALREPTQNGWIRWDCPKLTHEIVILDCFDLPVKNGTRDAVVFFRSKPGGPIQSNATMEPLMIPAPHVAGKDRKYSIVTCMAVLYGTPPLLEEVIRYQQTIGVDHVHMIAEPSIRETGALEQPIVKESLKTGFASLDIYEPVLNLYQVSDHSQMLAYQQCYLQYLGTYDYISYIDTDDFFALRVPGKKKLDYYIENWCSHGSCSFKWFQYYPDCGLKPGRPKDGNMTEWLTSSVNMLRSVPKSIHKLNALLDITTHSVGRLLSGTVVNVPPEKATVIHVRANAQPPDKKC